MSLSQVQIIRSLGEALTWFEKELAWGVKPADLPHLTGRVGELYAAMTTRGQMALATNQNGYDVVSAEGERISVKTITSSTHVTVNKRTFQHVDRVLVLRMNFDDGEVSIEEVLNCPADEFLTHASDKTDNYIYSISRNPRPRHALGELIIIAEVRHGPHRIVQYENGTIIVERDGVTELAKPVLREIAADIGVSLLNANDNPKNTRQLGAEVLAVLKVRGDDGDVDLSQI